jgi:hypothetical protein
MIQEASYLIPSRRLKPWVITMSGWNFSVGEPDAKISEMGWQNPTLKSSHGTLFPLLPGQLSSAVYSAGSSAYLEKSKMAEAARLMDIRLAD